MCIPAPHRLLFGRYPFQIHGVQCKSFESFLQALKFEDEKTRIFVCGILDEKDLKRIRDIGSDWIKTQLLYWGGTCFKRNSKEYQTLITTAFECLCLHPDFQNVLCMAEYSSLGVIARPDDITQSVFTRREAQTLLFEARDRLDNFSKNGHLVIPTGLSYIH